MGRERSQQGKRKLTGVTDMFTILIAVFSQLYTYYKKLDTVFTLNTCNLLCVNVTSIKWFKHGCPYFAGARKHIQNDLPPVCYQSSQVGFFLLDSSHFNFNSATMRYHHNIRYHYFRLKLGGKKRSTFCQSLLASEFFL